MTAEHTAVDNNGNISDTKAQQTRAECQTQQATVWQVTNFSHKTIEGHRHHRPHRSQHSHSTTC